MVAAKVEEMEKFEISTDGLIANVHELSVELGSLRDAGGRELLWQAGPAWPWHAPNLLPIVGWLRDDRLRHDGKEYQLTQHGFARDRCFTLLTRQKTAYHALRGRVTGSWENTTKGMRVHVTKITAIGRR